MHQSNGRTEVMLLFWFIGQLVGDKKLQVSHPERKSQLLKRAEHSSFLHCGSFVQSPILIMVTETVIFKRIHP